MMDSTAKLRCSEETDFVVLYYDQSDIEEIDENEDHSVEDDLTTNLNQPEDVNSPSSSNQIDENEDHSVKDDSTTNLNQPKDVNSPSSSNQIDKQHSNEGLEFSLNVANGAYQERVFKSPPYPGKSALETSELVSQSIFFLVIVFGGLIFIISLLRSLPNAHEPSASPPPPCFRPDYFTRSGYNDYTSGPSCGSGDSRTSSGPFIPPDTGTKTKTGYATTIRR